MFIEASPTEELRLNLNVIYLIVSHSTASHDIFFLLFYGVLAASILSFSLWFPPSKRPLIVTNPILFLMQELYNIAIPLDLWLSIRWSYHHLVFVLSCISSLSRSTLKYTVLGVSSSFNPWKTCGRKFGISSEWVV